jgi:tetratricopeptide (TPR) repeat protein
LNPEYIQNRITKAYCLKETGKYKASAKVYKTALKLDTAKLYQHTILSNLGKALQFSKRYKKAVKTYNILIEYDPDYCLAYYNKARIYALMGNTELALENLKKAIEYGKNVVNINPGEDAKIEPDFDNIRNEKEFHILLYSPKSK